MRHGRCSCSMSFGGDRGRRYRMAAGQPRRAVRLDHGCLHLHEHHEHFRTAGRDQDCVGVHPQHRRHVPRLARAALDGVARARRHPRSCGSRIHRRGGDRRGGAPHREAAGHGHPGGIPGKAERGAGRASPDRSGRRAVSGGAAGRRVAVQRGVRCPRREHRRFPWLAARAPRCPTR